MTRKDAEVKQLPNGWIGEDETDRQRLTETKGTCWVVFLAPLRFGVFNTLEDAEGFFQEQLRDDYRKPLQPVRYIDGKQFGAF